MSVLPHVFALLAGGNEPASFLDDNFNALRNVTPTVQTTAYTTVVGDHLRPIQVSQGATISLGDASTMVAGGLGYKVEIINLDASQTSTINLVNATNTLSGTANGTFSLPPRCSVRFMVNLAGNGYEVQFGSAASASFTPSGITVVSGITVQEWLRLNRIVHGWIPTTYWAGISARTGTTDLQPYFQNAVDDVYADGGGQIFVPNGYYVIKNPIRLKDHVSLLGAGPGSHIENTNTSTGTDFGPCIFMFGLYAASGTAEIQDETFYAINNASRSAISVTTTTASDAGNFSAGDIVFIRNSTEYVLSGHDNNIPFDAEINEVISANSGTGVITLKYPLSETFSTSATIARSSNTLLNNSQTAKVVKRASFGNFRITQRADANRGVSSFGGAFECLVHDLWITSCANFFSCNAFARSGIERVRGITSNVALEFAYWSHNSYARDVHFARITGYPSTLSRMAMFTERARDCEYIDCTMDGGAIDAGVLLVAASKRCKWKGGNLRAISATGTNYPVTISRTPFGADTAGPVDNVVEGAVIEANAPTYIVEFNTADVTGLGSTLRGIGNTLRGCKILGAPGTAAVRFDNFTQDEKTEGNEIRLTNTAVAISVHASATANKIMDDDCGANTISLANNSNFVRPKKTLGTQYNYYNDTFAAHSEIVETTVWTYTVLNASAEFVHAQARLEFLANITAGSTNGQKILKLKVNGTAISTVTLLAAETGQVRWLMDFSGSTSTTVENAGTLDRIGVLSTIFSTTAVAGSFDIVVTVSVANALDVINVRRRYFTQTAGEVTYT